MTDAAMAVNTAYGIGIRRGACDDVVDQVSMAGQAVVLQDPTVRFGDHDRFMEILQREPPRVTITIVGLGEPFRQAGMGQMAVDAGGDGVVAGFLPRIELRLHDVTIYAGSGVGAEVGESLGVLECDHTDTAQDAQEDGDPGQLGR